MYPIVVLLEDTNTELTLWLTEEQREKANKDSNYLQQLVNESTATTVTNDDNGQDNDDFKSLNEPTISGDESSSFIWPHLAVEELLRLYEEYRSEFDSGKRHIQVWTKIAQELEQINPEFSANAVQCQTKLNGLKKTYRKILEHNENTGNITINWPYFDKMNELFGPPESTESKIAVSEFDFSTIMSPSMAVEETAEEEPGKMKLPKERKSLISAFEKYLGGLREDRQRKREEREQYKIEKERIRRERFERLLELKDRQHKEKMEMLRELCHAIRKLSTPDTTDRDNETASYSGDVGDFELMHTSPNDEKYMWSRSAVIKLLDFYEEYKDDFGSGRRHKKIWMDISIRMRETDPRFSANPSQCQTKLLGLKKQYRKILEQAETTGNFETNWPYFEKMNELFGKLEWVENPVKLEGKPKKRKLENLFQNYMAQFKKQRRARAEEKEHLKIQTVQEKQDNIQTLLELKMEQNKEKMELLNNLTKPRSSRC